ncbi:MAG: hypothetical protein ACSHX3_00525 [Litorimonas sp.]
MNWTAILIAAVCGGAFAGGGVLLANWLGRPQFRSAIVAVATVIGIGVASQINDRLPVKMNIDTFSLSDLADEAPIYRVLINKDPSSALILETGLKEDFQSGNFTINEITDRTRLRLGVIVTNKTIVAPASLQREYANIAIEMFEYLKATKPNLCRKIALGEPIGDLSPYMPQSYAETEEAVMVRVVETLSVVGASGDVARGKEIASETIVAWADMTGVDTQSPNFLESLSDIQWCDIALALGYAKLSMPDQDRRDLFAFEADAANPSQ